ncbi:MAG: hypothetical protein WAS33_15075 [Candidatus Promineifilaceae bacterium]
MTIIQVFHNPRFLEYRGNHDELFLPVSPTASIELESEMSPDEQLNMAYARTQHGVHYASWFHDPTVMPHLRSSSVGDLIGLENGELFVVEPMGFQPYRPNTVPWQTALAQALRQLETAVERSDLAALKSTIQQSLIPIHQALLAEGYPISELPKAWSNAQVGDLVGNEATGEYRVFARRLAPQWRAVLLLEHLPEGKLYRDDNGWTVLHPTKHKNIMGRWP